MTEPDKPLEFLAAPASGWCDPVTGECHIEPTEAELANDAVAREDPSTAG